MEALAVTVLQKLGSSAYKELWIVWNLKKDIEKMKNTVSMIKSVLLDAEIKANNQQVRNWLEELKDVLYDADDLLDDFSIEALRRKTMSRNKKVRIFFSKSNNIAYGLKLGHRMKAIQKRLDDIAKNKHALQLTDRPMENPIVYREQRQTYSFVSKNEVIGGEDEKKRIKRYLLDINATDNVSVIPIVGIGGLGKTALAQLVYNDNDVHKHFELKMWAYVSDEFDIKKITQEIIGDEKNSLMEQVQQQLRDKIRGKKFLLVLDDMWNEDRELWLKLKSLFMEGGKGSMMIVTKGFVFGKKTLIQLWVAEGFIQQSNDVRCVEDVGHEYFMSLLSMSFFQDVIIDECGGVSTCKMHDLMHDLARLIAGNEYVVLEGEEANIVNRTRYLSSPTSLPVAQTSSSSYKLRTFLLHPQMNASNCMRQTYFVSFLGLKLLRVLTLCGLNIAVIPNSIEEMKHLRYIDLSQNNVLQYLPSGITNLQNLQTLKLSQCYELKILPENLNKSLRHLELNGCVKLRCMPQGIGQLSNLQTLTLFVLHKNVNELVELNNLRGRLEIKGLDFLRKSAAEIESAKVLLEKRHLQQLELRWRYDYDFNISSPQANRDESWLEDEMILEALQPHCSLQKLVIDGFCGKRLPDWIWSLSSLMALEIHNCSGLTSLPEEMCNLVSLQKLCMYNCFPLEERCARPYGEDWEKISGIREVVIRPVIPSLLKYFT